MKRKHARFDEVAAMDYVPPENAVRLAERRVGGFVQRFNFNQTYGGNVHGARPMPTLMDLVVSAYLQGVNDAAQLFWKNGLELPPNAADAFAEQPEDDRPEVNAS